MFGVKASNLAIFRRERAVYAYFTLYTIYNFIQIADRCFDPDTPIDRT